MKKIIKEKRPSWDEYFIQISETVSARATCDRGMCGSIIVKDKKIISTGYVGAPAGCVHCDKVGHEMHKVIQEDGTESNHCIRTTHAEQNAIIQAARFGTSTEGATIYTKMAPCYVCAKMIINAGIKRVVCLKDYHGSKRTKEIFKEAKIEFEIIKSEMVTYSNM